MTTDNFNKLLDRAGMTSQEMACMFEVYISTVNRWRSGESAVPKGVTLVLESLVTGKCIADVLKLKAGI